MTWKRAIVLGASGGIGGALVDALGAAGTQVIALARPQIDLTDEATLARAASEIGEGGPVDLIFVASGILAPPGGGPEKSLREVDSAAMAEVFAVNATGPLLAAKHFVPLLPRAGRSAFVVLGARVGSISDNRLGGWYAYRAAKAALAMNVKTLSVELARTHPDSVCVALHPGTVETRLSAPFVRSVPGDRLFTPEESAGHLLTVLRDLRPLDSGGHFAWDGTRIEP
ncbi:SDR family NAD(P)-dependent oxidoreductase [Tsuneonella amylolytica]|uniref:SDR family NAD(P)-dependent oxidoreductase n=1 Tax=Tsuneonella amylolytica TaxID=2338327 RepID=UPI000EAAABA4|nr:SDR family NAD(P)-dependent oxidoreductase [Tsuneonella amylolytica]